MDDMVAARTVIDEPRRVENGKDYSVTPITFEASWDRVKLKGDVYRPKNGDEKGAVIVHHGISGNRFDVAEYAEGLAKDGFLVLAYDARGHNESEGELNVHRMASDVSSAIDTIRKDYGYTEVGLIGHSLGGVVSSVATANDSRIKAFVSLSTPASARDVCEAQGRLKLRFYDKMKEYWPQHRNRMMKLLDFPVPDFVQNAGRNIRKMKKKLFKIKDTYCWEGKGLRIPSYSRHAEALLSMPDAIDYMPGIKVPCIIFNGSAEKDITPKQALKLYDACGSAQKELVILSGETHDYMKSRGTVAAYAGKLFSKPNPPGTAVDYAEKMFSECLDNSHYNNPKARKRG